MHVRRPAGKIESKIPFPWIGYIYSHMKLRQTFSTRPLLRLRQRYVWMQEGGEVLATFRGSKIKDYNSISLVTPNDIYHGKWVNNWHLILTTILLGQLWVILKRQRYLIRINCINYTPGMSDLLWIFKLLEVWELDRGTQASETVILPFHSLGPPSIWTTKEIIGNHVVGIWH